MKTTGGGGTSKSAVTGNVLPEKASLPTGNDQKADSGPQATQAANVENLQALVQQTNETLLNRFSNLKFTIDEGTNINVVRIEDSETGELIRQIPSEAMIAIAQALEEVSQGMMLKETV